MVANGLVSVPLPVASEPVVATYHRGPICMDPQPTPKAPTFDPLAPAATQDEFSAKV